MSKVNMLLTELSVCALPFDHIDADVWTVRVTWRGGDRYAVQRGPFVLAVEALKTPEWEYEPIPSSRTDEFKARTRFDYHTAVQFAVEQAPKVRINGMTAADLLARFPEKETP